MHNSHFLSVITALTAPVLHMAVLNHVATSNKPLLLSDIYDVSTQEGKEGVWHCFTGGMFVGVVYDADQGVYKTSTRALYSGSITHLQKLNQLGLIVSGDVTKVVQKLSKDFGVFKEHLSLYRLDCVSLMEDGTPQFKVVVPRDKLYPSTLELVPVASIPYLIGTWQTLSKQGQVVCIDVQIGSDFDIHKGTFDVAAYYTYLTTKGCPPSLIERQMALLSWYQPFDWASLTCKMICLEESVYKSTCVTIGLESISTLTVLGDFNQLDLDTSTLFKDIRDVRGIHVIFRRYVRKFKRSDLERVNFVNLSGYPTVSAAVQFLQSWASEVPADALYSTMAFNPSLFPDLQNALTLYAERNKALLAMQSVQLSSDLSLRDKELQSLLKTGVVELIGQTKTGSTFSYFVTNSEKALRSHYGKGYIGVYESPRTRLYSLKTLVEQGKGVNVKVEIEYGLWGLLPISFEQFVELGQSEQLCVVVQAIADLPARNTTQVEGMIISRRLFANSASDYFFQFNVGRIHAVFYAPVG